MLLNKEVGLNITSIGNKDFLAFIFNIHNKQKSVLVNLDFLTDIYWETVHGSEFLYLRFSKDIGGLRYYRTLTNHFLFQFIKRNTCLICCKNVSAQEFIKSIFLRTTN